MLDVSKNLFLKVIYLWVHYRGNIPSSLNSRSFRNHKMRFTWSSNNKISCFLLNFFVFYLKFVKKVSPKPTTEITKLSRHILIIERAYNCFVSLLKLQFFSLRDQIPQRFRRPKVEIHWAKIALLVVPKGGTILILDIEYWGVDPLNLLRKKLKKAFFVADDSLFFNLLEFFHKNFLPRHTGDREITSKHISTGPLFFHLLVLL